MDSSFQTVRHDITRSPNTSLGLSAIQRGVLLAEIRPIPDAYTRHGSLDALTLIKQAQ
jgi:hypothetical protein